MPGTPSNSTASNGTPRNGAPVNEARAPSFAFGPAEALAAGNDRRAESFVFAPAEAPPAAPVESFSDLWLTPEPPSGAHATSSNEPPPLRWSVALIAGACGVLLVVGLVLFLIGVIGGDDDPNPKDDRSSSLVGGRFQ